MNQESESTDGGMAGTGRWLAVASELPCSVVVMLFAGQILGRAWMGETGAMYGTLFGALLGFFFGAWSIYATVKRYDKMEKRLRSRQSYVPPQEEIFEDYDFDAVDDEEES